MPKIKDRTGEKYGRLIVIKRIEAAEDNKIIICGYGHHKEFILRRAKDLNKKVTVVTIFEYTKGYRSGDRRGIIIDEIDMTVSAILGIKNIKAYGTIDIEKETNTIYFIKLAWFGLRRKIRGRTIRNK